MQLQRDQRSNFPEKAQHEEWKILYTRDAKPVINASYSYHLRSALNTHCATLFAICNAHYGHGTEQCHSLSRNYFVASFSCIPFFPSRSSVSTRHYRGWRPIERETESSSSSTGVWKRQPFHSRILADERRASRKKATWPMRGGGKNRRRKGEGTTEVKRRRDLKTDSNEERYTVVKGRFPVEGWSETRKRTKKQGGFRRIESTVTHESMRTLVEIFDEYVQYKIYKYN